MKQVNITVHGKVQNVGFRYFSQMKAVQFYIKGWVKNSDNDSVEIFAEGTQENLELFIDELRKGNPFSVVDEIIVEETEKMEHHNSFKIKY